jgi:hypothetical protein
MPKNPSIPFPKGAASGASTPKPETTKPAGLPTAGSEEVFEEDFTGVTNEFPMAEEGMHHAKVIDLEKSESSSGNPQYVWQFRITAGPSKDIELRHWTSLLPQARWKAAEALDAVGITAAGSIAKFRKSDVLGRPCILEVFHDTYDGKTNHKVKHVHPPTEDSVRFAKEDKTPF